MMMMMTASDSTLAHPFERLTTCFLWCIGSRYMYDDGIPPATTGAGVSL